MYAGGGKLVDLLGTQRGFTVIMLFWSLACASHALAAGFAMLLTSRSLLGMGEGWHNNHHAFPRSAVHGLDRWQLDVSAWVIAGFERLGLATDVQRIPSEVLARKRLAG